MPSLTQPLIVRLVVLCVLRPLSWMSGSRVNDPRKNGAICYKTQTYLGLYNWIGSIPKLLRELAEVLTELISIIYQQLCLTGEAPVD